jgi:hypothetical protein
MKKFLYGRLHDANKGYDFYVRPAQDVGPLLKALSTDLIPDEKTLIFLYNHNGRIIFGLRQQLSLKDSFGRLRANFTGYELDQSPSSLPFFEALQEKLAEISDEAHACHRLLDQDSSCGPSLRETTILFGSGRFQQNNDWDRAVAGIQRNPTASLLLMFDEDGNSIPAPSETAFSQKHYPADPREEMAPHRPTSSADSTCRPRGENSAGIRSDVTLGNDERIILPPPPDMNEDKKEPGFLGSTWKSIKNRFMCGEEQDPVKKSPPFPKGPKRK